MTNREKAIVMARTGVVMLTGDKINEFYKYLSELYGRPVYTHEVAALDIKEKSMPDFIGLCREEQPERIYCKDCKHRGTGDCPMHFVEWIEWDDDGYMECDDVVTDNTTDDGFCNFAKGKEEHD